MKNNICIIGLGYVGLTLSVAMAEKKFNVIGVEKNQSILDKLDKDQSHFFEPFINKKIKKIKKKNYLDIINQYQITLIAQLI